jgi:hypothetical protein
VAENEGYRLFYEVDDEGRFRAVLPSGKRPVITPVLPDRIRRVYAAFQEPEVPKRLWR